MSFLDRLLGRREDPTVDWKAFSLPIPDLDVAAMQFGTLHFGDEIGAAAFLGRPDRFQWNHGENCELLYATGGFQLEFAEGKLSYLCFFIGPDEYLPRDKALQFSEPRLRGGAPDGTVLTRNTDRALIEKLLGQPTLVDVDSDETILVYTRENVTMEFEIDGETRGLKRVNLYPEAG